MVMWVTEHQLYKHKCTFKRDTYPGKNKYAEPHLEYLIGWWNWWREPENTTDAHTINVTNMKTNKVLKYT